MLGSVWLCGLYRGALDVLRSSRALCPCFSVCFGILVTSLGEEGAGICASRTFVCLFCACMLLSFFSSSWYRGLAAVCDCRIPWTFLLTFFVGRILEGLLTMSSVGFIAAPSVD